MSGMFRGLQIGISTLMAHQRAIDVTSQNIANVNTPGYQRQRVNLQELSGPSGRGNPPILGNGVYAESVTRFVTPFIDQQLRHQRGLKSQADEMQTLLLDVESALVEPSENGLSAHLDDFWKAWQNLAVTPTEPATRVSLLQTAERLTASISDAYTFIEQMTESLDTQIGIDVNRINDVAQEVSTLNQQILRANAQAGGSGKGAIPLEQRRDALLFELSDMVDITVSMQDTGLARVSIGNYALVDDGGARAIELDADKNIVWAESGRDFQYQFGRMKALTEMRDDVIPSVLTDLDQMAQTLIDQVNGAHRNGFGLDGATGLDFFEGVDAKTISINQTLHDTPESVATANAAGQIGDASVAQEIADLARQPVMGNGGQSSISAFHRAMVTQIGMQAQRAEGQLASSESIFNHLTDRRQSISGVSMDEEVANLLSYEKAFQAGARIINVMDEMLDQVINGMGLVGR